MSSTLFLCYSVVDSLRPQPRYGFTPNCQNKNEYRSVNSSICLVTGLPAPWPALVSILNKIGRSRLVPFLLRPASERPSFWRAWDRRGVVVGGHE